MIHISESVQRFSNNVFLQISHTPFFYPSWSPLTEFIETKTHVLTAKSWCFVIFPLMQNPLYFPCSKVSYIPASNTMDLTQSSTYYLLHITTPLTHALPYDIRFSVATPSIQAFVQGFSFLKTFSTSHFVIIR